MFGIFFTLDFSFMSIAWWSSFFPSTPGDILIRLYSWKWAFLLLAADFRTLWTFLKSHFLPPSTDWESLTPAPNKVTFQQILCPPGLPGAWPLGNKGTCCVEVAIMYLHSSESWSPGGQSTGWQGHNPIFHFQLLSQTPLRPEIRPEKPSEKRFESLCTKVTRNHKVQLLFVWRERVPREPQRTHVLPLLIEWNKINCTLRVSDSSGLLRAVSLFSVVSELGLAFKKKNCHFCSINCLPPLTLNQGQCLLNVITFQVACMAKRQPLGQESHVVLYKVRIRYNWRLFSYPKMQGGRFPLCCISNRMICITFTGQVLAQRFETSQLGRVSLTLWKVSGRTFWKGVGHLFWLHVKGDLLPRKCLFLLSTCTRFSSTSHVSNDGDIGVVIIRKQKVRQNFCKHCRNATHEPWGVEHRAWLLRVCSLSCKRGGSIKSAVGP